MKILLFGKSGQVGWELARCLPELGEVVALGRDEADFSAPESLRSIVRQHEPDIIVNAVAYTSVDKAEEEEGLAHIINADAPQVLADEAKNAGALLVHYSTDYVFDGRKLSPYLESDQTGPVNAYGRTKLAGEHSILASGCDCLIFRTSWVYSHRGHNFLLTMLRLAKERDTLSIVDDQVGAPTSAAMIADATVSSLKIRMRGSVTQDSVAQDSMLQDLMPMGNSCGVYHMTASGETSWYGFARAIFDEAESVGLQGKKLNLKAIHSADYHVAATRPMNSRLVNTKLKSDFSYTMPGWRDGLKECIDMLAKE